MSKPGELPEPTKGDSAALTPIGADRNGVRSYLIARMPTFNFSPNELQALVRFFEGASAQSQPYIAAKLEPLTEQERSLARQIFTSKEAPCLKCHMTGEPGHDKTATAPNFLIANERLKPSWTARWLIEPGIISPGTAMPSNLFRQENGRWLVKGQMSDDLKAYEGDHVNLLVRYMFQITPDEQRKLAGAGGGASAAAATGKPPQPPKVSSRRYRPEQMMARSGGIVISH